MTEAAWIVDWLHLLTRWFHLVAGAAWIGASFYFVWLNNNVRPIEDDRGGRLAGGLWAVHGGAFYEVQKYKGAPEKLPETLHWFKWEAYLTWISGIFLLLFVFWLKPTLMMVGPDAPVSPSAAVGVGVGALVVGWIVYDLLCKSPLVRKPLLLAVVGYALLAGAAFGLSQVLNPRAAYIHVGAMIGTMMALNVFFVIIPGQRAMVDAMVEGREPPVERGQAGALRSLHNNYFTLPVLFIMVSNHFPFTYGHNVGWAVLIALGLLGALVKHWMNVHERGGKAPLVLPAVAVGMLALAFVSHGPLKASATDGDGARDPSINTAAAAPPFDEVKRILEVRCAVCHAKKPTFEGIVEAPKGFMLDDPKRWGAQASLIHQQAVATQVMPLANVTKMTPEERQTLGAWIAAGAPVPE